MLDILRGNNAKDPSLASRSGALRSRTVIVLANGKAALLTHTVSPEALDGDGAGKGLA